MRKVYIRADGSVQIGLGHVIRSCALSEMLRTRFECTFFIRKPSGYLQKEIENVGCKIVEMPTYNSYEEEASNWAESLQGDEIIVLDGYGFDTRYQEIIKKRGCKLVCIDDIHAYHFIADLVINHGTLKSDFYSKESYTKLLLGPKFCLLRKSFLSTQRDWTLSEGRGNQIFLNFGGADKLNLTTTYLNKIVNYSFIDKIHVVIGSAFEHVDILMANNKLDGRVCIHRSISAENLVEIINQCTVAIVPGSTIALECASIGIGMITGYYVDNQVDINTMMVEQGMSFSLNDFTSTETDLQSLLSLTLSELNKVKMHNHQQLLFDKRSPERLISEFEILSNQVQ